MAELITRRQALGGDALSTLRDAALSSRYVGSSPLRGTFTASRGFGVSFTKDGIDQVRRKLPFLAPFIELVTRPSSHRDLWTWSERAARHLRSRQPNSFYINLLLVPPGAGVAPHVDATLRAPSGVEGAVPRVVSVLYLQYRGGDGGLLRLWRDSGSQHVVRPEPGSLVHFRGELTHEVTPVDALADGVEAGLEHVRASLVCEQYWFDDTALARLPPMVIKSQYGFAAALEEASKRPLPDLTLD